MTWRFLRSDTQVTDLLRAFLDFALAVAVDNLALKSEANTATIGGGGDRYEFFAANRGNVSTGLPTASA
jgi:hypothetical protein